MSAAPTQYTRQNNFVADATNNPSITVAGIATDLDAEYEAIRTSVNQTISRLNEIQRPDGLLRSSVLDPAEYAAITSAVSGATNAATSATAAASSAASASTSATTATNRAAEATAAASNVAGYVTTATQKATAAAASATAAATSEANALSSSTNANTKATAAATSATSASNSATTASTKATEAAASAAGAASSASTASTKATEAAASAASVAGQTTTATNAATSATASAISATNKATLASDSAVSAQNSATIATTKAAEAALSALDASSKATYAASAVNSMDLVFNSFDSRFLGTRTSDPTTNNGQPLVGGAVYYNSVQNKVKFYNGATWDVADVAAQNYANSAFSSSTSAALSSANASSYATNAAASAASAQGFADAAAASYDSFDDRYIGARSSDPLTDNDGNGFVTGALYFNTTINRMLVWNGLSWASIEAGAAGTLEPSVPYGTSSQYYRGDKTWQAFNKAAIGLGNVDNTSDANKPISTAVQTALNGKLGATANAVSATTAATAASATVAASCSGNAATASKLQTARTINGVTFDGTQNITVTADANSHNHDDRYYTEAEMAVLLAGKQAAGTYSVPGHTHDDRYYTETEVNTLLAGKQAAGSYQPAGNYQPAGTYVQPAGTRTVTNVQVLTQAEYNASSISSTTLYFII